MMKSFILAATLVSSVSATAALNSTMPDCVLYPLSDSCTDHANPAAKLNTFSFRIHNPLLLEICRDNVSLAKCRQLDPKDFKAEISPEEYERLEQLNRQYQRYSRANGEKTFLADLNWMLNQERVKNEQYLNTILKLSEVDAKKTAATIERIRLAVETQDMLDDRFGVVRVSLDVTR